MATATWPAAFKAALNLVGVPAGAPRDPVFEATEQDQDTLRHMFDQLGISHQ
jgi:4-hydroxy-tetrahydrodipicolinate synthase